jgi:hypothetical protein
MKSKWGMVSGGGKKAAPEEKVEIPFNLDELFNLNYGFEPLKQVLTDIY